MKSFIIILANETTTDDTFTLTLTGNVVQSTVWLPAPIWLAYAISTTTSQISPLTNKPPIPTEIVCTDSYSLYECIVKLGTTMEKRIVIDKMALRESYEKREFHER
ncbi:hypothetical protein CkaCkLH20_12604 [Colletotrichum karsti]|uniref:Uncharacterized protein n=1 Tax=Colletotrichum karsti TaxID=1095194 RepID=A0A9P6LF33_9PEZI|nr:uncharacterized protein CkaCkLH20_12604 [Colletotrichum karsti]KAF9869897.1 hypothetical protein CkaCkLH20_12604 [Colletotrichum karsti]